MTKQTPDDELLTIIKEEKTRSLGFDGLTDYSSPELLSKRETALNYYKMDMSDDMPNLENRSAVVSSDVHDVIQQVMPDVTEIYMTEDVASFEAMAPGDEEAARQETEFVNWVVFNQNNAFDFLNTTFKDALLLGVGYLMWQWEEPPEPETEDFENIAEQDFQNALMVCGEQRLSNVAQNEDGTFNFTLAAPSKDGKVVITAWSPNDVAVSDDTLKLGEGTYCAFRTRVRRQELLLDGYDPDDIDNLPRFGSNYSEVEIARDQSGESIHWMGGSSIRGMDMVEVIYHYVRIIEPPKNKPTIYHVVTGSDCNSILKKEVVNAVPACAFKPFPVSHRFYGESLADMVVEIQRIKTALLRMGLDSGYYALNQRMIVAQGGVTKHTVGDLLNNNPGGIVRAKTTDAVAPLQSGGLSFDPFTTIEAINNLKEERAGVSRTSMGIAPDTMHDTASGQLALMSSAQRRVRYIARMFAETGMKDLFRGVHSMLRQHSSIEQTVKLTGGWVPVDPSSWAQRHDLSIEIGNSGGRDYDLANFQQLANLQQEAVKAQQGPSGPLTNPEYLLTLARKMTSRMGIKNPEQYWPDPKAAAQQMAQQQQQPQQDPKVMQAQAEFQMKAQMAQQQAQLDQQMAQAKFEHERQLDIARLEHEKQMDLLKAQNENDRALTQVKTKQAQIAAELQLKQHEQELENLLNQKAMYVAAHNTQQQMVMDHHQNTVKTALDHVNTHLDRQLEEKQLEQATQISPTRPGGDPLS